MSTVQMIDHIENIRIGLVSMSAIGVGGISNTLADEIMDEFYESLWDYEPFKDEMVVMDEGCDVSDVADYFEDVSLTYKENKDIVNLFVDIMTNRL